MIEELLEGNFLKWGDFHKKCCPDVHKWESVADDSVKWWGEAIHV
jgi:hypothetical protein